MEYNALSDNGRYEKIYNYIKQSKEINYKFTPSMLVEELKQLNKYLGIPEKLTDVGVKENVIEDMARDAMKSGNVLVNPRQTTEKDIIELYKRVI